MAFLLPTSLQKIFSLCAQNTGKPVQLQQSDIIEIKSGLGRLASLEDRIRTLEGEREQLRKIITELRKEGADKDTQIKLYVAQLDGITEDCKVLQEENRQLRLALKQANSDSSIDADKQALVKLVFVARVSPDETVSSERVPRTVEKEVTTLWLSCGEDFSTNKKNCLHYSHHNGKSVFTTENPGMYACRGCTNQKRPCLVYDKNEDKMVLLPLHPAIRDSKKTHPKKRDTQSEYWVSSPQGSVRSSVATHANIIVKIAEVKNSVRKGETERFYGAKTEG